MAARPADQHRPHEPAAAISRPPEMEDWLNRNIFHPPARALAAALAPIGVSPNAVSVLGGLMIVAAGIAYIGLAWPVSVLLGFLCHFLWHVFDGADGTLARLTGKSSPAGELIDGVCDYAGHVILYTILGVSLFGSIGHWCWPLGFGAGFSRVLQANHSESQRRIYLWRVYGVPWLQHAQASEDELFRRQGLVTRIFTAMARGYIKLAQATSPRADRADAIIERLQDDAAGLAAARRLCRRAGRRMLVIQAWLGPNPRTFLLAASMATGSAFYYFLIECTLLNLLLAWSVVHQGRANARLTAKLEGVGGPRRHG